MRAFERENLCHDPIHGYIAFTSHAGLAEGEVAERQIIDNPWVQRLRQIHQLQTAWYVYPTAEHTRFQHVMGVMHLASRVVAALWDSLARCAADAGEPLPSRGYIETLLRMAGLLHDVGHGPFGHFLDVHLLGDFGLTHETLGAKIIREELGDQLRRVRRNPNSALVEDEQLDPDQIAWLVVRPTPGDDEGRPRWLGHLRSLLSGIYTIDNMDFVLRDAYMSGYSARSFDLDRLLHYSFFTERGLTIHDRGIDALMRFMAVRAELFRTIYFHRTVRALDLTLSELFADSKMYLFDGNPAEQLERYRLFTEWSLLVDVSRWPQSDDPDRQELGARWQDFLARRVPWQTVCQRNLVFQEGDSEQGSIFSEANLVEQRLRDRLPAALKQMPLKVDIARTIYRPHTRGPAADQNFLYDSARACVRPLSDNQLFKNLPVSHRICRIYANSRDHATEVATALDQLIGPGAGDDLTNM